MNSTILVKIFTKANSKDLYFGTLQCRKAVSGVQQIMKKLRDLREDHDMTQEDVAKYLGTSQTMYARYERCANELPLRHFTALCKLYGVSADELLETDPKENKT